MRGTPELFGQAKRNLKTSHPPWPTITHVIDSVGSENRVGNEVAVVFTIDVRCAKHVEAAEEDCEVSPHAFAGDGRVSDITRTSAVHVGQQIAILAHSEDVAAPEDGAELVPPVAADYHGMPNIAGRSVIAVGQQLAPLIHGVDAVFA